MNKKETLHDINIIIVADEEDMLKVFEYILNNEGYYNIQMFSDSKKAIKHFIELRKPYYYDVALIDIILFSILFIMSSYASLSSSLSGLSRVISNKSSLNGIVILIILSYSA